eukprot:COSAG02_NODE_8565_length_2522_cov_2.349979_2_plen_608_part_00
MAQRRSHGNVDVDDRIVVNPMAKSDDPEAKLKHKNPPPTYTTLGERFLAGTLVAPTLLNWLVLAQARFIGTSELVDTEGMSHVILRNRTYNFEHFFLLASMACIATVFVHVWLTLRAIARRQQLDQLNATGCGPYAERLEEAENQARRLTGAEWAHLALVGFDFFFASVVVFPASFYSNVLVAVIAILPGLAVAALVYFLLAPARAAVLHTQRTNSVAFAGDALHGSMVVLMVQAFVVLRYAHLSCRICPQTFRLTQRDRWSRFAAFAIHYPADLFDRDCGFREENGHRHRNRDTATRDTWKDVAAISTCRGDLFKDGVTPDSNAKVYNFYAPLHNQFGGSCAFLGYLVLGTVTYYAARGQGLLHDKLFTELDMGTTHVIALFFWLLVTFSVMGWAAAMNAEFDTHHELYYTFPGWWPFGIGFAGMWGVLWHDTIRAALGKSNDHHITECKPIVMSCPEKGTLDPFGDGPYEELVMDKVMELQQCDKVKMGFDRAGTSTAVPEDKPLFDSNDPANIRLTRWFYGYKTSAKRILQVESQGFQGQIVVICIEGGPITKVEAEEMGQIVEDAKADARMSGIKPRIKIVQLSYHDFLREYDAAALSSTQME